jgi:hypothetical protein
VADLEFFAWPMPDQKFYIQNGKKPFSKFGEVP